MRTSERNEIIENIDEFVRLIGDEEKSLGFRVMLFVFTVLVIALIWSIFLILLINTKGLIILVLLGVWMLFSVVRKLGNILNAKDE